VSSAAPARRCGECALCCTVLRVDELGKLGGTPCRALREDGHGCSIYERRPGVCRRYRCLWLSGSLREEDRPDRLGAVLDLVPGAGNMRLEIREAVPGAFDRSPRLREIADAYREAVAVRISDVADVMDPDRPFRLLLAGGVEHRVAGDRIEVLRDGQLLEERRRPWLERAARRIGLALAARRLRRAARTGRMA
jgi:hypothetical protein